MPRLRAFTVRMLALLRRRRAEDEFAAELESHIAMHTEDGVRAGLSSEEARRWALIKVGGAEQVRQAVRNRRILPWLENLLRDVRCALRGFRRSPIFAITAIVTLALGIGAATAVFSVVDLILFRPLPYAHADRIVSMGLVHSLEREEFTMGSFYFDWLDHQRPFAAIASQGTMIHSCDLVENNPEQLGCIPIQAGFLPMLGISPVLGRNFLPFEDQPGGPQVALISYSLWSGHYNRDPGIVDREINLDGQETRVVGVLPKGFELPTVESADVLLPMQLNRAVQNKVNGGFGDPMRTFARLKPGVTIAQAIAEMQPLFRRTQQIIPPGIRYDVHLSIRSLRERETEGARLPAWILLGAVLAVLLIACANVAGLMMARGAAREREMAVRAALGASKRRLMQQSLTEAVLLSLAGAAAGIAMAEALLHIFIAVAPAGILFIGRARLDLRVATFAVLLALACGAIFGLFPAFEKPRAGTLTARAAGTGKGAWLRRALVVAQIAFSMILLCVAGLLARSFQNIEDQKLGFRTDGVMTVQIALPWFRYNTGQKQMDFYLHAEEAIHRLPGIHAVAITDSVPPGGWQGDLRFSALATQDTPHPTSGAGGDVVVTRRVTPSYFQLLDIPIVTGRGFSEKDRTSSQTLVVISRLLAARLFPSEDPVGKRVQAPGYDGNLWYTVIGVADDAKNGGLTEQDEPEIYFLRRNVVSDWNGRTPLLVVDSVLPVNTVMPWVRSQVASLDPTVPVEMTSLNRTIRSLAARPLFETALLGFFSLTGLLVAIIGLYGVISFLATQRTREIGVRMALGASRRDILSLVLREGLRLTVFGAAVGLAAALVLSRVLKSLLYQVGPHDPLSFILVTLLLVLVALAAMLIPARVAMKTDPMKALRVE